MRIDILTIFPDMFESPFADSIIKRAKDKTAVEIHIHDIRDFTTNKHRKVDDSPYGGGAGMVMMADPIVRAAESIDGYKSASILALTPAGKKFNQQMAHEFSELPHIILICGRYEGMDERAIEILKAEEVSVGDYVLSGGELPAMVISDALIRLIPGVLGNEASTSEESFEGGLLEYPHYTRPEEYKGLKVPSELINGNHAIIKEFRQKSSFAKTQQNRPDMIKADDVSKKVSK